ncbi:reverse transcriptase domain-containing protein [Tanacetum coccineum]
MDTKKPAVTNKVPNSKSTWMLYTNGASSSDGSGAGLMLVSPEGKEYTYALRFQFETANNEAEYEALLAGLRIIEEMEIKDLVIVIDSNQNKKADALSKLSSMTFEHLTKEVLVEVLANRSINSKEVSKITIETEKNWMTPIYEYVLSGLLSEDPKEARKVLRRLKKSYKKYTKQCYYWPSIHRETAEAIQECAHCQTYSTAARMPNHDMTALNNAWPFSH